MAFSGFPTSGLAFLRALQEHNRREWFDAQRKTWDEEILPGLLEWCGELTERLRDVMPHLTFVPRQGGSVLRLNRDVRFSRDKRPYDTTACAVLWEGEDKHDAPCVSLQIGADEVVFGGGLAPFEERRVDRYRKLLLDGASVERLESALAEAKRHGLKAEAERVPRTPRGFDPEGPLAELSKLTGLSLVKKTKTGPWLHTREAVDRSEAAARAYAPLHAWLRDELCR
jgi:uncharacterized protein (TIGR02453 family)